MKAQVEHSNFCFLLSKVYIVTKCCQNWVRSWKCVGLLSCFRWDKGDLWSANMHSCWWRFVFEVEVKGSTCRISTAKIISPHKFESPSPLMMKFRSLSVLQWKKSSARCGNHFYWWTVDKWKIRVPWYGFPSLQLMKLWLSGHALLKTSASTVLVVWQERYMKAQQPVKRVYDLLLR